MQSMSQSLLLLFGVAWIKCRLSIYINIRLFLRSNSDAVFRQLEIPCNKEELRKHFITCKLIVQISGRWYFENDSLLCGGGGCS